MANIAKMESIVKSVLNDKNVNVLSVSDNKVDNTAKKTNIVFEALRTALEEAIKELEVRKSEKAAERSKADGFSVPFFEAKELFRENAELLNELVNFREEALPEMANARIKEMEENGVMPIPSETEMIETILKEYRAKLETLIAALTVEQAFTVRRSEARTIRLNESIASMTMGISCKKIHRTARLVTVEHAVQQMLNIPLVLFSANEKLRFKLKEQFQNDVLFRLGYRGLKVIDDNGDVKLYGGLGSSAGHQKKEVLVMGDAKIMKAHERLFWFGRTMEDFIQNVKLTGAEFWKMRAILLRPVMEPFQTKNGTPLTINDVLMVPSVEKVYKILNALTVGRTNKDDPLIVKGQAETKAVLGDGAILFLFQILCQGQLCGLGYKGFGVDASSSLEEVARKNGLTVEQILNMKVKDIDGVLRRIGDYKAVCCAESWKFDKAFATYADYLAWVNEMAKYYPGIQYIYTLRQAEEIEDEIKVRRLTRTLIQQFMWMSPKEIRKLTRKCRENLHEDKTFSGAITKLAGLKKDEADRTDLDRVFAAAPWLVSNKNVQELLKSWWTRKLIEAASGKFKTEGQYPYIMQDPVALLEVWLLGKDPDDPSIGILRGDEVSCADVQDRRELLCVRFPANFLTLMVMTNRAFGKVFGTLNNVMAISVHSTILIMQDGDVDGDEMAVIYNMLAIEVAKRMIAEFNPPVVLFQHGSKATRTTHANKAAFIREAYEALYNAKKYDSVGKYANLSTNLAYLAINEHFKATKASDEVERSKHAKQRDEWLEMMAAASTGAIMAIDQVKGNQVDKDLIKYLKEAGDAVDAAMQVTAKELGIKDKDAFSGMWRPFVHAYNCMAKGRDVTGKQLPSNPNNFLDQISDLVLRSAGSWDDFDFAGCIFSKDAANEALTNHVVPANKAVAEGIVTKEMELLIKENWFKPSGNKGTADKETAETLAKIKVGNKVGMKELIKMLWRNEAAMSYRMEGETLSEKKLEYAKVCRRVLSILVEGNEWTEMYGKNGVPVGHVYTLEEKHAILSNYVIRDALELGKHGNGLEGNKGSYAMFCLKLFAKEILDNLKRNNIDDSVFWQNGSVSMEATLQEMQIDDMEDELELLGVSVQEKDEVDDIPEMSEEELQKFAEENYCFFDYSDYDYE